MLRWQVLSTKARNEGRMSTTQYCECDNTHEANDTVCQWCWEHGRRKWADPEVVLERESEAWRVLAEAYDAGTVASEFLCHAKDELLLAPDVSARMRARVDEDVGSKVVAYDPDNGDEDMTREEMHAARVLACLMFAEEAEEEGR
jgi:hypothetical protein